MSGQHAEQKTVKRMSVANKASAGMTGWENFFYAVCCFFTLGIWHFEKSMRKRAFLEAMISYYE